MVLLLLVSHWFSGVVMEMSVISGMASAYHHPPVGKLLSSCCCYCCCYFISWRRLSVLLALHGHANDNSIKAQCLAGLGARCLVSIT
uniref:Putative secreted protein n=1 Tax=Anopheles triannulatus TaxID=58253 RepID=A0A2M4B517_9DIPT